MKTLFNNGWRFRLSDIDHDIGLLSEEKDWTDVEIPHDWLIYDSANLYRTGMGLYKKTFTTALSDGEVMSLIFDGVYMNCTVYVNGKSAGEWKYGYTAFCVDVTPYLNNGTNEILVAVRHEAPNSRWYSGAGIFRNIWCNIQGETRILNDGVYINAKLTSDGGKVEVRTEFEGTPCEIRHTLFDKSGAEVASGSCFTLFDPILWDIDNPYIYTLKTELLKDGAVVDSETNNVGFRTAEFSPDEGFLLNGRKIKMHGVCLHHDMGALGAAFNINAAERQLSIMKSMGANSIRISHNPPAREFLDLCDRMGLLVIDEAFDMWELPKNKCDYAGFFPEWHKKDIASWIRRDRNHPCVILWSIGNEIYDTHKDEHGLELAEMLSAEVKKHDMLENAQVTIASNYMPFQNAQNVADRIKIAGYNYAENIYDSHHEEHSDWFIYGSETVSAVRSRGVYHFPIDIPILTCEDMQCSDLGNSVVGWGISAEKAWILDRDRDFCGGQFIWTGMDYIGEPTPYPAKNSYFGAVDTAGIPKAAYYFYKSVWDKKAKPFIKLFPHWDWNEGQLIDIIAYSNMSEAELFLNGKSLGRQKIDFENGQKLHFEWRQAYEKGTLEVVAYDEGGEIAASDKKTSCSEPFEIRIEYADKPYFANCTDLIYINVSVCDKNGVPVENARSRIFVKTGGALRLAGIDNGDSTDYDSYKGNNKRLFSGQLTVILQTASLSGTGFAEFSSVGLKGAHAQFNILPCDIPDGTALPVTSPMEIDHRANEIPLRKIELSADKLTLDKNSNQAVVKARILPENADYRDITWKCVLDTGAETDAALIESDGLSAKITAKGDGRFKIRTMCGNGKNHKEIISELDFIAEGLGAAFKDPFKFILASCYDISRAPLKIIEKGAVAGVNKARTILGFKNLLFGAVKTDTLRLYIGTTSYFDEIPVEIWLGDPDKAQSRHLSTVSFPRNNLHYDFAPHDFKLPKRLSDRADICFVLDRRCVFGGFEFLDNRAYEMISAAERDEIYGDNFKISGRKIENIGNNVIISFNSLNFGEKGADKIIICGYAPSGNTISLRVKKNDAEETQVLEFGKCNDYSEQTFDIGKITDKADISFVFLPGSNFNFDSFKFQ